ncbi:hypothetical protein ACFQY0_17900 [Haloferula chungangensis]|uniref:Secreted protein n=1 Tax=Haloferula chungangensis TaxID=1048331 RepID=A0ABW2L9M3_9BACT
MRPLRSLTSIVVLLLSSALSPSSSAELPELQEKEWFGCFAGFKNSEVRFTVSTTGELTLEPVYEDGNPRSYIRMPVSWGIEVTMPNGRKGLQTVIPGSLESEDEPTDELERLTLRGKFEGGAEAQLIIEQKRGTISIGGRITHNGTYLPENIQFQVSARVLNFYGHNEIKLKDDPKAFEALIIEDLTELKWTNGKRQRLNSVEPRDMASEEVNGPGIAEVEVSIKAIDRQFLFEATGDSMITMSNRQGAALHQGMLVNWAPLSGKDPKSTARLAISVE